MEYESDFEQSRIELASDPYRPAYHSAAPYGWMNDPDGKEETVLTVDVEAGTLIIDPSRPDSLGVQFFSKGDDAVIHSTDVWDMDPVWPIGR